MKNGVWGALGVVGLIAGAGAAMRRTGSPALLTMEDREKLARERGGTLLLKSGSRAALQQGYVKGNIAQLWKLASENIYGRSQNLDFIATREALQNSRDAIRKAIRKGLIGKGEGRFDVRWDEATRTIEWEDNGTGMTSSVVFNTFLSLGETTKTSQQEGQAGGFGLAKAVLLGCSEDFRWKMHTLDSIYVSEGLDTPVRRYQAPFYKQGVILTVYNVKSSRWHGGNTIHNLLASSDAGITMTLNGEQVTPAFSGRGSIIAKGANWGNGVQGTVKSYKRLDNNGSIYVRLKGLTQFIENPQITSDVVVDIETSLLPTSPSYPFNPSRMLLEGTASYTFYELRKELTIDTFSATKKLAEVTLDDAETSPEEIRQNEAAEAAITASLLSDPDFLELMKEAEASGVVLRSALKQQQRQAVGRGRVEEQQRSGAQAATKKRQIAQVQAPPAFSDFVQNVADQAGPVSQAKRQELRGKIGKKGPKVDANPFAGVGKVRINAEHWDKKRLAPFVKNKAAMIPLLVLWKLTIRLILARKGLGSSFSVGFVFDDNALAMHQGGMGASTFYLNPARVVKVIEKSPNRPDVVAALLYNAAAHESTHHLGYSYHDEDFTITRQAVGDYNVDLLPLLTAATSKLLGLGSGVPARAHAATAPAKKKPVIRSDLRFDLDSYRELTGGDSYKLREEVFRLLAPHADELGISLSDPYVYLNDDRNSARVGASDLSFSIFGNDDEGERYDYTIRYAPKKYGDYDDEKVASVVKPSAYERDYDARIKNVDLATPITKWLIKKIEQINKKLGVKKKTRQPQTRQPQIRQQARQQARQQQQTRQQARQQQARQQTRQQQQQQSPQAIYTLTYHLARFKRELRRDVKAGLVPNNVRDLSEVGTYVDVMDYGGFTDDAYALHQTDPQRDAKLTEQVWEGIDAWIQQGGLR